MNTRISYLYRDAANYKVHNACVIRGEVTEEQIAVIANSLMDREYFKPSMVGLPETTFVDLGYRAYDDDPDFFELGSNGDLSGSFEETDLPFDVDMTGQELAERFVAAQEMGWHETMEHTMALEG